MYFIKLAVNLLCVVRFIVVICVARVGGKHMGGCARAFASISRWSARCWHISFTNAGIPSTRPERVIKNTQLYLDFYSGYSENTSLLSQIYRIFQLTIDEKANWNEKQGFHIITKAPWLSRNSCWKSLGRLNICSNFITRWIKAWFTSEVTVYDSYNTSGI